MLVMPHARVNGLDICHEQVGDPADPTLALVPGLGTQLVEWDLEFCTMIADRGVHVVRFDNRDVGLSTHLDDQPVDVMAVLAAVSAGEAPTVPYLLADMAADLVGLLDHLGVARAHVAGMSMGGMIAQAAAIGHPDRVLSLTSIMSTTGDPDVGQPSAEAMASLFAPPATDRDEAGDHKVRHAHVWGSPAFLDDERLRRRGAELFDRAHDPQATARQLAAVLASGSRSAALAEPPRFTCMPEGGVGPHHRGTMHIGPSLEYLERAYDDAKYGRVSASPYIEAHVRAAGEDGRVTVRVHVQYVPYALRGAEWDSGSSHALGRSVVGRIAEAVPGFDEWVLEQHVLAVGEGSAVEARVRQRPGRCRRPR